MVGQLKERRYKILILDEDYYPIFEGFTDSFNLEAQEEEDSFVGHLGYEPYKIWKNNIVGYTYSGKLLPFDHGNGEQHGLMRIKKPEA